MSGYRKVVLLIVAVLVSCDSSIEKHSNGESALVKQTPYLLRNISSADLAVRVEIDGSIQTYTGENGSEFNWVIAVNLRENQRYSIKIEWLFVDILLMEETGSFFTDADNPNILLDLDFITNGLPRFDNDCDGQSNLAEVLAGSNPEIAETSLQDACNSEPPMPTNPDEIVFPWVAQRFPSATISEEVFPIFNQPFQIRSHRATTPSSFGLTLYTDPEEQTMEHSALFEFHFHPTNGKQFGIGFSNAVKYSIGGNLAVGEFAVAEAIDVNPECRAMNPDLETQGAFCSIPFDWKIQNWYELVVEGITGTEWGIWVVDTQTGERFGMGLMTTDVDTVWQFVEVGIKYDDPIAAGSCALGLPTTTIHFKGGNRPTPSNDYGLRLPTPILSPCVNFGGGYNSSIRTQSEVPLYSLTLGQLQ